MALYVDLGTLAADPAFIKRVSYAVTKFASYILNEATTATNHAARAKWAASAILNPALVAAAISTAVCLDDNVVYGLANTLDPDIQRATEIACGLLLINAGA